MDKPISFEISMGNAGNSLDGQTQASATQNEDGNNQKHLLFTDFGRFSLI